MSEQGAMFVNMPEDSDTAAPPAVVAVGAPVQSGRLQRGDDSVIDT
jgi:hypothetical protein